LKTITRVFAINYAIVVTDLPVFFLLKSA